MRISEIKPLKNGRFGIFADGNFLLSVDEETLVRSGLKPGAEVTGEQLDRLGEEAGFADAREKALRLLSYRDHSKEELRRKLARSASGEAAQAAVETMVRLGLVNDGAYAEKLARELILRRMMGRGRALRELIRRGIGRELAEEAVDGVEVDSAAQILNILKKKYPTCATDEKVRRRAVAALLRNGYEWDEIRDVLRRCGADDNGND